VNGDWGAGLGGFWYGGVMGKLATSVGDHPLPHKGRYSISIILWCVWEQGDAFWTVREGIIARGVWRRVTRVET